MVITRFPPVSRADPDGLLAIGGDLEPDSLIMAYRGGIFPWPVDGETLAWFAPPKRAVLFLDEFHLSRRLRRSLSKSAFENRMDHDFLGVITHCAELANRGDQDGTWITEEIIGAYSELFRMGYCHSFETYLEGNLVGGIYGVQIGAFFAAESSFFRVSDASKSAMCFMVNYLRGAGASWFDCQVLTPFSLGFGAREVPRDEYMKMLSSAVKT